MFRVICSFQYRSFQYLLAVECTIEISLIFFAFESIVYTICIVQVLCQTFQIEKSRVRQAHKQKKLIQKPKVEKLNEIYNSKNFGHFDVNMPTLDLTSNHIPNKKNGYFCNAWLWLNPKNAICFRSVGKIFIFGLLWICELFSEHLLFSFWGPQLPTIGTKNILSVIFTIPLSKITTTHRF